MWGSALVIHDIDADGDGDGDDQLVVAAALMDATGRINSGQVRMYKGGGSTLDPCYDEIDNTDQIDARLGTALSSGDYNGDGKTDLILSAHLYDSGRSNRGAVFVYLR